MENRFFDEKNGLWYEKQGEYYLPCLELSKEENQMEWVGRMNNIRNRATEIVDAELIFA